MKALEKYDKAFEKIVKKFVHAYYEDAYYYIIGEGGNLCPDVVAVNEDWFWSIQDMYVALKHNIDRDTLIRRYDYSLNKASLKTSGEEKTYVNLYHFAFGDYEYTDEERKQDEEKIEMARKLLFNSIADERKRLNKD